MNKLPVYAFAALLLAGSVNARQSDAEVERVQYSGTLGQSRIGLTVVVEGGHPGKGHYFYQKYLTDIPLTAVQDNNSLLLKERRGAFRLHFKGNGSEGAQPLTFHNSVGLDGTWTSTDGGRTLPVTLTLETVLPGLAGARRYGDVTSESDAAFEKRVQAFYHAVLAGDRTVAARYVSYPLRINSKPPKIIKTPAAFAAAWNSIFSPAYLARLRNDLPHDMFVHQGMAMLGSGDVWFDAKGATALNIDSPN